MVPVKRFSPVAALALAAMLAGEASAQDEPEAPDPPDPSAGQKLAIQTRPSVVRVVAGYQVTIAFGGRSEEKFVGGHGSGFFVDPSGYIATNAHVVELVHGDEAQAQNKVVSNLVAEVARGANVSGMDIARFEQAVRGAITKIQRVTVVVLPNGDKLSYDVKAYGTPVSVGGTKDVAILKVQTKNAPTLSIGDEKTVQIQDRIFAVGYPGAADDMIGVLDEKAILQATITDGTVSAHKKSADGVPVIQVTTIISPGNSGGPAINEKGEVIGLATFGHAQRQGYNFLVPASTVMEFVKQAGAVNEPSLTNQAFAEGLALHWDHRYSEAIAKFEEVKQLFPSHSEIDPLITEAMELKRQGKEKKAESSAGAVIAIVVVAGLVLGLGGWYALNRRRAPAVGHGWHPMAHAGSGAHAMSAHPPPPAHAPAHAAAPPGGVAKTIAVSAGASGGHSLAGLACVRGLLHGQHFPLGAHGVIIGRQPGAAQIVLHDGRVSSKHVWIGFQDGVLLAVDQGSTNGTFVNDMSRGRITRAELKHGDTVIVSEPDVLTLTVLLQR